MEQILKIQNLSASYEGKTVLHHINLEIPKGQITAIIGPSGCGKTTLLHCLNGMLKENPGATTVGEIFLDGKNVNTLPDDELRRRIGLVFQTPSPFPFSVYKNMTYALKYYGVHDKHTLNRIVTEKLQIVGLYDEVKDELNKSAQKLSGGQQQRLCIARALTVNPDILLLDEPCSALDIKSSAVLEDLFLKMKETYTMIIVTHNIAQARRISDNTAFFLNGRLIEFQDTQRFFSSPQQQETQEFLSGTFG